MMTNLCIVATTEFTGGAELYIARQAKALGSAGLHCRLLGDLDTWPNRLERNSLGAGPKWGTKTLGFGVAHLPSERRTLRDLVARIDQPVFNLHFKREQVGYSGLLANYGPVVWTEHGVFPKGSYGAAIRPFYRRASRNVERIICVSDIVASDISRIVGPHIDVVVLDSAVDTNRMSPVSRESRDQAKEAFNLPAGAAVGFIGRLERSKRPMLAVESANIAGVACLVAGEGSLSDQIDDLQSPTTKWLGHVDDVTRFYRAIDVHLFASDGTGEGFPTVLLEAAACGVPTVAIRGCGFEHHVLKAGGAVAEASSDSVAAALHKVLRDLPRRATAARVWAEGRDVDSWVQSYRELLGMEQTK
jgi:glycosyltransferase involved in cell wall biosynthesis